MEYIYIYREPNTVIQGVFDDGRWIFDIGDFILAAIDTEENFQNFERLRNGSRCETIKLLSSDGEYEEHNVYTSPLTAFGL